MKFLKIRKILKKYNIRFNFKISLICFLLNNLTLLSMAFLPLVFLSVLFIYHPDAWAPEPVNNKVISLYQADKSLIEKLLVDFESVKYLLISFMHIMWRISLGISICVLLNIYILLNVWHELSKGKK